MKIFKALSKSIPPNFITDVKKLNRISNINSGGCCLAALAIYKLAEAYGLKPQIIFMSDKSYVKKGLARGWPLGANHIYVKIGFKYYDSTGSYWRHELSSIYNYKHLIKVPYELAFKSALDYRHWNTNFDRKHGISEINKIINIGIKRI